MKTLIKKVGTNSEGATFILTEKASMGGTFKAKQWNVSWDAIGRALFGDQYSDAVSVKEYQDEREKI